MPRLTLAAPCLLAVAAAALPLNSASAQDTGVEIVVTPLNPGVAMVVGRGGNIGLVHGDGEALLIDDQFAPLTESILAAVAEHTEAPLRWVLNTHWHGDHTGGNANLSRAGALIVAHENVRARMATDQHMQAFDRDVPAAPAEALPVITHKHGATLYVAGTRLDLVHVPAAHTDGDSLVHMPDVDVLHTGDTFFNGMYPFIDLGSGGGIEGLLAAADVSLSLCGPDTAIIPGHGPLAGRAELAAYRDMLAGVLAAVRALMAEGHDLDAIVAAAPSAPWDDAWGGGFIAPDAFATTVATSLGAD
ncbi:MAG: MBL fold metallo-hydrolase [Planctomycetota bacterium]|nr:MAG: MBL fold metallo-hydrolase [Planctomycetota bacterium]